METFYEIRDSIRVGKKYRPKFRSRSVPKTDRRFKIHEFKSKTGISPKGIDEFSEDWRQVRSVFQPPSPQVAALVSDEKLVRLGISQFLQTLIKSASFLLSGTSNATQAWRLLIGCSKKSPAGVIVRSNFFIAKLVKQPPIL